MADTQPRFRIEVRAEGPGPPAEIRLRGLLKAMLRRFGLRCVSVEEVQAPASPPASTPLPVRAAADARGAA